MSYSTAMTMTVMDYYISACIPRYKYSAAAETCNNYTKQVVGEDLVVRQGIDIACEQKIVWSTGCTPADTLQCGYQIILGINFNLAFLPWNPPSPSPPPGPSPSIDM